MGVAGYAGMLFFVLLSMFGLYSNPSLRSLLRFYHLDAHFYTLAGLVGEILFAGPLVLWVLRKRKLPGLAQSIYWKCKNKIAGWAFLAGFVTGVAYSFAKSVLAGRGYQAEGIGYIAAFAVLDGFVQPIAEEIYFRGILFIGLALRFGNIPSIVAVTLLFCVAHPQRWFAVLPLAVLLGVVRLYTGSVRACLACHAAYNLSLALLMLPLRL